MHHVPVSLWFPDVPSLQQVHAQSFPRSDGYQPVDTAARLDEDPPQHHGTGAASVFIGNQRSRRGSGDRSAERCSERVIRVEHADTAGAVFQAVSRQCSSIAESPRRGRQSASPFDRNDSGFLEEEDDAPPGQQRLTDSDLFNGGVTAVIFMNTVLIGVQVAFIQYRSIAANFEYIDCAFTVLYTIEMCMRIKERGWGFFLAPKTRLWNIFDLSITAMSDIDSLLVITGGGGDHGEEVCRIFRILRLLRVFRAVRFLGDVEYVIIMAGKAMLKLCFLVSLVIFVAAIVSTHLLYDSPDPVVLESFGDLGKSMWSLLKIMTLGEAKAMNHIVSEHPGMVPFFVAFIFCASIALISLVPAIFIALNLEARGKEQRKVQEQKAREVSGRRLRVVELAFDHALRKASRPPGQGGDGRLASQGVTWVEMESALGSAKIGKFFQGDSPKEQDEVRESLSICFNRVHFEREPSAVLGTGCSEQTAPLRIPRCQMLQGFEQVQRLTVAHVWQSLYQHRKILESILSELLARPSPAVEEPSTKVAAPAVLRTSCLESGSAIPAQPAAAADEASGQPLPLAQALPSVPSSVPPSVSAAESSLQDTIPAACSIGPPSPVRTSALDSSPSHRLADWTLPPPAKVRLPLSENHC